MTHDEFKTEFGYMRARCPMFKTDDMRGLAAWYFRELEPFTAAQLHQAVKQYTETEPNSWPPLGTLKIMCDEISRWRHNAGYPRPRFKMLPHGCDLNSKRVIVSGLRARIAMLINRDEALHMLCPGKPEPICPMCGTIQKPWQNPFFVKLTELFPTETKGWNTYHKGLLLCSNCSKLNYPQQFIHPINRSEVL